MNSFKSSMKKLADKSKEGIDSLSGKKQDTKTTSSATSNPSNQPVYISSSSSVTTTSDYGGDNVQKQTSYIHGNENGGYTYSSHDQPVSLDKQPPSRPPPPSNTAVSLDKPNRPLPPGNNGATAGGPPPPRPPSRPVQPPSQPVVQQPPPPSRPVQPPPPSRPSGPPPSQPHQPQPPSRPSGPPPSLPHQQPPPPSRPPNKPVPSPYNSANSSPYDGASVNLSKSTDSGKKRGSSDGASLTDSWNKGTEAVDTHTKIALNSIGVDTHQGAIKANIPVLKLVDRNFISTIQYTEVILDVPSSTLKSIELGVKAEVVAKKERLVIYKTVYEEIIIIQIGNVYIYTSLHEKPCFRAYPFHYIIGDNYGNVFMLKLDKDTDKESMDKLEVILMYYSTFYRVPVKENYSDGTAQKIDNTAGKVEGGSMKVNRALISGGGYVAKGAGKVGEFYKSNAKKYDGPEMTEEQRRELEDPNSKINKTNEGSQKFMKTTASISQGIVKGFGFVGGKVSETYHSTDYYKEKQEKQKAHEAIHGKDEKKEAGAAAAGTGVSAFKNVWSGLEEGVLISARGVRDASVDAKAHSGGEYAAAKHRKHWNTAGDVTISTVNVVSIMSATWIKAALYAAAGAVSYDPNMVQALSGSYWKAGWVSVKTDILSGSGWKPRWLILRNPTLAIYSSSKDPHDKPLESFYLNTVKGIEKLSLERAQKPYAFEIKTNAGSIYLSIDAPEVDWSAEPLGKPNPDAELYQWINTITSVSNYIGELEPPKEQKSN